jgi:hypothetical protein
MMGGTAIRPGGREVVQGFGKQFQGTMPVSNTAAAGSTMPTASPTEAAPMEPMFPELPELPEKEEEQPNININMDSLGSNLANWAAGFKTARSSRQRAGRKVQGLGQQRVSPTGSFRGSVG